MTIWDQSYNEGYPEQVASSVFESGDYTSPVDMGPAVPVQGGGAGFRTHHGVLLCWIFALVALIVLGMVFKTHNLG